jgi:hypothetical protein
VANAAATSGARVETDPAIARCNDDADADPRIMLECKSE